jgi:hypothetical protein
MWPIHASRNWRLQASSELGKSGSLKLEVTQLQQRNRELLESVKLLESRVRARTISIAIQCLWGSGLDDVV